jgi:uncharacterized RDD family membrane protein YckC
MPVTPLAKANEWISEHAHPWRRYFARMLDNTVNGAIASFLLGFVLFILWPNDAQAFFDTFAKNRALDTVAALMLAIPFNAILIGFTGGSLGKWLFGVRVLTADGRPSGIGRAFHREVVIWCKGLGLGIPIITFFTLLSAHRTLGKTGHTSWDEALNTEILYRPKGFRQIIGAALGGVVLLTALICLNLPGQPRLRVADLPSAVVTAVGQNTIKVNGPFGYGTAKEVQRVLDASPNVPNIHS